MFRAAFQEYSSAFLAHLAHAFYWETFYHHGICKFGEFRWYQGSAVVHCCSITNYVQLFATPRVATHQASLSFIISQSLLKFIVH